MGNSIRAIQVCLSNRLDVPDNDDIGIAGIIGERPSRYAKSPPIWNHTFRQLGIETTYLPFDVESENLPRLVETLRNSENYMGGSVTVPYKIAIMEHLDEIESLAHQIGAVNTIVRTPDGRLVGSNTDGKGGIDALVQVQPGHAAPFMESLEGLNVLMIGAGGAGRAMAFYLADAIGNGKLTLLNRTHERAEALAREIAAAYNNAVVAPQSEIERVARGVDLIINCTSCGQSGLHTRGQGRVVTLEPYSALAPVSPTGVEQAKGISLLEIYRACVQLSKKDILVNNRLSLELALSLNSRVCFFDIVYTPLETVFLRQARFAGHPTQNGKAMNVGQAAEAMFNAVCKRYFQERDGWTEETYNQILKVMYSVW